MGFYKTPGSFLGCGLGPLKGPNGGGEGPPLGLAQVKSHPSHHVNSPVSNTVFWKHDSPTQEEATHLQPKWIFGVILKSWIEMSTALIRQWQVPGSVHLRRVHLHLPGTSFPCYHLWRWVTWETAPGCPWQPRHRESAGRWMCGSPDDAIRCPSLNVSVSLVHVWLRKDTLISLSSYLKAESYFVQRGGLASNEVHGWELLRTCTSLSTCFSKSPLSESQLGRNSRKTRLAGPGNFCGGSSKQPHCLLTSLPHLFGHIDFYCTFSEGLLKNPQRAESGFFLSSTQLKCFCEMWGQGLESVTLGLNPSSAIASCA